MNGEPPQNEIPQFSIPFGNKLIELAEIEEGATVLDVGMGNGKATFFPALKKVGEHGQVIGIDISEEMVEETCETIRKNNTICVPRQKRYCVCSEKEENSG